MGRTAYQQLWGVVSGAVRDAFNRHPDYLTKKGRVSALTSVTKRVTGTVLSFAVQATAESREAATEMGAASSIPADDAVHVIRTHPPEYVSDRCYHAIRRALFPRAVRELRRDAHSFKRARKAKAAQLRSELQAQSNIPLAEAIEAIRSIPIRPEEGRERA